MLHRLARSAAVAAARLWYALPRRRGVVVLGTGLAEAHEAERLRLAAGPAHPSPLAGKRYDPWAGEMRLSKIGRLPLDGEIARLAGSYREMDTVARRAFRLSLSLDDLYTLLWFAKRMAVFALRGGPDLPDGLAAVSMIEPQRIDYRDLPWSLAGLEHASQRTSSDTTAAFMSAASLAETTVAEEIRRVANRRWRHMKLCDACMYAEVDTPDGIGLTEWWGGRYDPTIDVTAIALDIADDIERLGFQPQDPWLGADLPSVWLEDSQTVRKALKSVRAVASMHADLRSDLDPGHSLHGAPGQGAMAWVLELRDDVSSSALAAAIRGPERRGVAVGPLFGLVVARSKSVGASQRQAEDRLDTMVDRVRDRLERG